LRFVSVAVPVPFLDPLTYNVPDRYATVPPIGARVRVPIGTRTVTGCVVAHAASFDGDATPRDVTDVVDEEPFLPPAIVELCAWVADYYIAGVGDAIGVALPPGSRRESAYKTQRIAAVSAHGLAALGADVGEDGMRLTAKQRDALEILATAPAGLPMATLRERGATTDVLRRLSTRGLVAFRDERHERDPFEGGARMDVTRDDDRLLTPEQVVAVDTLTGLSDAGRFHVALLHGVTGSGKTEVYLRLADRVCGAGKQVLLLVPEIALTPSVVSLFRSAFGARVAIQHSGLSDGERHDQWQRIRGGAISVVIGTRSAVFTPLDNLGLIIVDEEHDTSYKQDESPRYHGRDVAIVRAKARGALVVLGSATPSMESYQHALSGKYAHVPLTRRVLERPLASVRLVNMRDEYTDAGPDVVISRALAVALQERLDRREQVLVLLNRRGYATAVFCRQCGDTFECPNCSVSLTVHRARGGWRGRCHYCNYAMDVPRSCRKCAAPYLEQTGFGTEKVEQQLRERFPTARVSRVDRDSMRRKGALTTLLSAFAAGKIDVLVGTQMIAKGHDFPRVTLVGVISADVGLGLADFRAGERTFQLLTQVAGRAGRGQQAGEAIVQTLYPEHYSIQLAGQQDYPAFFEREHAYRRAMRYPPQVAMISVVVRGRTFEEAMRIATDIAERLRPSARRAGFHVLGPAPAPLGRLRGEHRVQCFLKGTRRAEMRHGLKAVLAEVPEVRRRITVDVDPLSML
jgi:primosomal protein N' (replication factor Y)